MSSGSISAGEPIDDAYFSTVPGLNLDMCMIQCDHICKFFYQTCLFLVGHPLLFLVLQLFEAGGVSKRIIKQVGGWLVSFVFQYFRHKACCQKFNNGYYSYFKGYYR